jgi:hypothetical protein
MLQFSSQPSWQQNSSSYQKPYSLAHWSWHQKRELKAPKTPCTLKPQRSKEQSSWDTWYLRPFLIFTTHTHKQLTNNVINRAFERSPASSTPSHGTPSSAPPKYSPTLPSSSAHSLSSSFSTGGALLSFFPSLAIPLN